MGAEVSGYLIEIARFAPVVLFSILLSFRGSWVDCAALFVSCLHAIALGFISRPRAMEMDTRVKELESKVARIINRG